MPFSIVRSVVVDPVKVVKIQLITTRERAQRHELELLLTL